MIMNIQNINTTPTRRFDNLILQHRYQIEVKPRLRILYLDEVNSENGSLSAYAATPT